MKSNGSVYVSLVFAALIGYFTYQWWFNPHRVVKRRLGELAAVLSVPANDDRLGRLGRLSELRGFLADSVTVRVGRTAPDLTSRDAVLAAVSAWTPPPGGTNVDFVDVRVTVADSTARAIAMVEITSRDPQTRQQTLDAREASFVLRKQDSVWVVSEVEAREPRPTP
jgi:ketosteroid isomerase-like protein